MKKQNYKNAICPLNRIAKSKTCTHNKCITSNVYKYMYTLISNMYWNYNI